MELMKRATQNKQFAELDHAIKTKVSLNNIENYVFKGFCTYSTFPTTRTVICAYYFS